MPRTLFTDVMIFEGTGEDLAPGEVVDAGGATLMPGMVNTHCHLTYNNGTTVAELTALPVEEHVLLTMHNAKHDLSLLQDRNALLAIMKDGQFHKPFQGRAAMGHPRRVVRPGGDQSVRGQCHGRAF